MLSELDSIISKWPGVKRRTSPSGGRVIFYIGDTNFCWLSLGSEMIQLWPALGPNSIVRRLERVGDKLRIVRQLTGAIDAVYIDPHCHLRERWSYPGFMCSEASLEEAVSLIRQAYEGARGGSGKRKRQDSRQSLAGLRKSRT